MQLAVAILMPLQRGRSHQPTPAEATRPQLAIYELGFATIPWEGTREDLIPIPAPAPALEQPIQSPSQTEAQSRTEQVTSTGQVTSEGQTTSEGSMSLESAV